MARYVTLLKFTDQGSKNVKDSPSRGRAFAKVAAKAGVKVDGQYWTVGKFDGVLVLSADSEQKILKLLVDLVALGNVRTQTLQAFSDKEFEAILSG